ncbi:DUF4115 domain-containing protein [Xylophilus rhododendri]|uniref:DUF4115 domain-containing protein n=1 Tax=Xylophilus rhododendri TaxID=2697032 RepID=A0A857JAM0_9BURK|nr:helix-turn-helix domain-containing protein [Xylophilus rhododendri]QHJ00768.1 DUF4115 domain-containing protein [Xylophilus rhododendri]
MSETDQPRPAGPGAGALLRDARERAGMHIASLAVMLKVPVSRLEALEADRYDLLPDPPFVRALAGGVCRALKLDPAPVLALLPQKLPPRLGADVKRTDGATFRTAKAAPASLAGLRSGLRHPAVWLVVLILVAAAVLLLVPAGRLDAWTQMVLGPRGEPAVPAPVGGVTDVTPPSSEPPVAAVAPEGPESMRGQAGTTVDAAPAPQAAAPAAAPVLQASPALPATAPAAAAAAVAADGLVNFNATAASWVRVSDSRGATVFEKVLQPGTAQSVGGTPPLTVVVGNAGATAVQVRGQALDLVPITRNNVARFEVK